MKKIFILASLWLSACTAHPGTEVPSPPGADATPAGPRKIDSVDYDVIMDLPAGWTYKEFDETHPPTVDAFTDIDSSTIIFALLTKEQTRITFFGSNLQSGETLEAFIRHRHPTGTIEPVETNDPDTPGLEGVFYINNETGPRGGGLFDIYIRFEAEVLWLRFEIVASTEAQFNEKSDEIQHIFDTLDFIPKI